MAELLKAEEEAEASTQESGAAAIALAFDHAANPTPPRAVEQYLAKHEQLIDGQLHHLKLEHWSKRLKVTVQALTLLVGVIALGVVLAVAWDAHNADGLVIKPFSVPPSLAQRGVTGEAVASTIMDKLTAITEFTNPSDRQKSIKAGETEHVSLAIPETGISLGQLEQWLRDKLGHERQVSGDLSLGSDDKLTMASRIGSHPLPAQSGSEADLDSMAQKLAETIYAKEQPTGWFQYLSAQNRWPEALQSAQRWLQTARSPEQRALALNGIGVATQRIQDNPAAGAPFFERAMAEDPLAFFPASNLAALARVAGREERSYSLLQEAVRRVRASKDQTAEARRSAELSYLSGAGFMTGDFQTVLRNAEEARHMGTPGYRGGIGTAQAAIEAMLHEYSSALADLKAQDPTTSPLMARSTEVTMADIDFGLSDWAGALDHQEKAEAITKSTPAQMLYPSPFVDAARRARLLAKLGRVEEAKRLADPLPNDCVPCLWVKAEVSSAAGDHAAEDRSYAEAVRLTPSLPLSNEAWGRALLERGQARDALAKFDAAIAKGPRYGDAFEGRGEALLALGDAKAAVAAFEHAASLVPKWGRLHLKWAEALAKLGARDRVRAELQIAAGLELTPAERAELIAQKV